MIASAIVHIVLVAFSLGFHIVFFFFFFLEAEARPHLPANPLAGPMSALSRRLPANKAMAEYPGKDRDTWPRLSLAQHNPAFLVDRVNLGKTLIWLLEIKTIVVISPMDGLRAV